jgi:hypothetical protein
MALMICAYLGELRGGAGAGRPRTHLLLHCCHTLVTLLLHGCYTVVTIMHHCYDTVATLLLAHTSACEHARRDQKPIVVLQ